MFEESQQSLEEKTSELEATCNNLASTRVVLTTTRQDLLVTMKEKEERGFLIEEHAKTEGKLLGEAEEVSIYQSCGADLS